MAVLRLVTPVAQSAARASMAWLSRCRALAGNLATGPGRSAVSERRRSNVIGPCRWLSRESLTQELEQMSQETLAPKIRVFPIPDASPAVPRPASGDRFFHFSLTAIGLVFLGVSLAGLPFARIVVPLAPLVPRAFLFGL